MFRRSRGKDLNLQALRFAKHFASPANHFSGLANQIGEVRSEWQQLAAAETTDLNRYGSSWMPILPWGSGYWSLPAATP